MTESTSSLSLSTSPTSIRSSCQNLDFETAQNIKDNLIMCSGEEDSNLASCNHHVEINNYSMCYGWSQAKPYAGYIITNHHPNDKDSQHQSHHSSNSTNTTNKSNKRSSHIVKKSNYHADNSNHELVYYVNIDPVTYKYRCKGYQEPNNGLNKYKPILIDQNCQNNLHQTDHQIQQQTQPLSTPLPAQLRQQDTSNNHQDHHHNNGLRNKATNAIISKSDDNNNLNIIDNLNQDSRLQYRKNYVQQQLQLSKPIKTGNPELSVNKMSIQPFANDRYHLKPLRQTSSPSSYLSHLSLGLRRAPDEYNKYFNDLTRLRFVDGRFLAKGKNIATNQFIER